MDIPPFDEDDPAVSPSVLKSSLTSIDWSKFSQDGLVDLLVRSVIYDAEGIIAFDKPAGLPYSGSKSSRVQIDRAMKAVKNLVAPDCERLHLVESLDKLASGIIYFAKTPERSEQLRKMINEGKIVHRFRVIAKGVPENQTADIDIPLHKILKESDVRWVPVREHTKNEICYDKTRYRLINYDKAIHVSLLDVFVNKSSNLNQLRSHLALGINCPLIGESKYNPKKMDAPVRLTAGILQSLGLKINHSRNVPMFAHLAEILVPIGTGSGSRFSVIKSNYPPLFTSVVKGLSLLRK